MNLLLDSNALIWWLRNDGTLRSEAIGAIQRADVVYVSAAAVWEMAIKRKLGRLRVPNDLEAQMDAHGFQHLEITIPHALAAGALERHHDDPFDRMQIAQAIAEDLTIVTRDREFEQYGVPLVGA